jgi:hypothetical protein
MKVTNEFSERDRKCWSDLFPGRDWRLARETREIKGTLIFFQKERDIPQPNTQPNRLVPQVNRTVNAIDPSGTDNSRVYESLRPELGQKRGKVDRLQKTEDNYSPFFKSHTTKNTPTPTQCEGIVRNVGQSMHSWYEDSRTFLAVVVILQLIFDTLAFI